MPTDPVLTLIAEMRAKADAMPEGEQYSTVPHFYGTDDDDSTCYLIRDAPEPGLVAADVPKRYARYFASLDPALVRALLDVVEAEHHRYNLEATEDPSQFQQDSPEWHEAVQAYGESRARLFVAWQLFRTLAAERVAS